MQAAAKPYLSIVVTTRNDDHGGDLLRRTQTFLNSLLHQCRRHSLDAELIFVEWNPPCDRPGLTEALRWPEESGPCQVRMIRVPPELHARYRYGDELPLYQMIGKNVGIRRARGEFILATNIDLIFSDALMRFLAERRLQADKMYRIDRHDVASEVPVDGPVEAQLAYCAQHVIRVNTREGTFAVGHAGLRAWATEDIGKAESGIFLGAGWFPPESNGVRWGRWIDTDAELIIEPDAAAGSRVLCLEAEPGPGARSGEVVLRLMDPDGQVVGEAPIRERCHVQFSLPPATGLRETYALRVEGGGQAVAYDPRKLNLRVYACGWNVPAAAAQNAKPPEEPVVRKATLLERASELWGRMMSGAPVRVPFTRWLARIVREIHRDGEGIVLRLPPVRRQPAPPPAPTETVAQEPEAPPAPPPRRAPALLHTNGCGDFTLLDRDSWFRLRGYPELDLFSINIDSLFCWAAYYAGAEEVVLREPMRLYHIEHGGGWTPEGERAMYRRLEQKGIGWLSYETVIELAGRMELWRVPMVFNLPDWGLGADALAEWSPVERRAGVEQGANLGG